MNIKNIVVIGLFLLSMFACKGPKNISDTDLQNIFRDIYMANAYTSNKYMLTDSMDIYSPVFGKYGYTIEDFKYTMRNLTKRKSSRLSDIIDGAIKDMDSELNVYKHRVHILDTVELIALERLKEVVYKDSIINIRKLADTSKLRIKIPVEVGNYKIVYNCVIDSSDHNSTQRTTYELIDSAGKKRHSNTQWLNRLKKDKMEITIEIAPGDKTLQIAIGSYGKNSLPPHMTVDSLYVTRYLPKKIAVDSITRLMTDIKLIIDDKNSIHYMLDSLTHKTDSVTLGVKPPRLAEKRDSLSRR